VKNSPSYQWYLKSPYKSIKHSTYFEVYDELFSRYRDKEITFVEIGVLGGGSLFMWRDFFGPKARIIGVDLNPNAKKWEHHGFEIFIGSQSDESFWKEFIKNVGQIDVVLDDGGHTYAQQIITTEMLLGCIKDGGMLVVEDTHTSYMGGFGPKRYSFIEYVKKFIDKINHRFGHLDRNRSDNRVWSIQSFESIVAFHINRQATDLLSEPTSNNGIDDTAQDFRHFGNNFIGSFDKNVSKLRFLRHIPGAKLLAGKVRSLIANRTDLTAAFRKYF
jgi:hypothetical protein